MLSYEALIAFAAFLAILGVMLSAIQNANSAASSAADYAAAKVQAEKCAALINALYAASSGDIENGNVNCFVKNEKIASKFSNMEASAILLYKNATIVETPNGTKILVMTDAHYR